MEFVGNNPPPSKLDKVFDKVIRGRYRKGERLKKKWDYRLRTPPIPPLYSLSVYPK